MKRLFDIIFSIIGIIVLSPLLVIVALLIMIDSKGGFLFKQKRIGLNGAVFMLYKFRTMKIGSDKSGLLTVGFRDNRITRLGGYLRKYKVDELPQLFNVLFGSMSFVGPRPEVSKYVDLYTKDQFEILRIRPGITDLASIYYKHENEILGAQENPEEFYIKIIMPHKLRLNKIYQNNISVLFDVRIIFRTIASIFN